MGYSDVLSESLSDQRVMSQAEASPFATEPIDPIYSEDLQEASSDRLDIRYE
jgi:hypothetical protein